MWVSMGGVAAEPLPSATASTDCAKSGLTLLLTEADAEEYCKGVFVVWADTNSWRKIYHFPEGRTKRGGFTCILEAKACGYRATKK